MLLHLLKILLALKTKQRGKDFDASPCLISNIRGSFKLIFCPSTGEKLAGVASSNASS